MPHFLQNSNQFLISPLSPGGEVQGLLVRYIIALAVMGKTVPPFQGESIQAIFLLDKEVRSVFPGIKLLHPIGGRRDDDHIFPVINQGLFGAHKKHHKGRGFLLNHRRYLGPGNRSRTEFINKIMQVKGE